MDRRHPLVAGTAAAAAVVAVLLAVLIQLRLPAAWAPDPPVTPDYPAGLAFPVLGALLLRRRPDLILGRLMLAGGLLMAFMVLIQTVMLQLASTGEVVAAGWLRPISVTFWALGGGLSAIVLPLYSPTGRLPSPRWRWFVVAAMVISVLQALNRVVRPDPDLARYPYPELIPNPLALPGFTVEQYLSATVVLFWAVNACVVTALVSLALRLRRADPAMRRQIAWPLAAFAIYVLFLVLGGEFWLATTIWTALIPVAIVFSVLRYRLFGIDTVISRTLVAAGLVLVVGAVYFAVGAVASLLVAEYHQIAGLTAALFAGAFFQPLRQALQRAVDRAMYGPVGDPALLAQRLTQELRTADPAEALAAVISVVRDGLAVDGVSVDVPEGVPSQVRSGEPGPGARVLPLVWHGELVGSLTIGRPESRRFADAHDERVVRTLLPYVADVAHAVRMAADLQRSRERILSAREEERRRLRRDLHDGLGQTLSGLAMTLNIARVNLRRSPAEADILLGDLRSGMDAVSGDLRALVYGLRPPALDDLGLAGAITELAGPDPATTVTSEGELDGLPAAVEVAAYRIAQEALTNARRHSGASNYRIHLAANGRELRLTVSDDGSGVPSHHRKGVGLASMRERAAELGGSCVISSGPCGTTVEALLPLSGAA
ncbi:sensor histidine kinase [Nonomuraea sp. NPDC050310]|uniref:sensor histidine kinase n=1 Tax=Nonomuraea sp. NPDC050310 TaxID=3154935 RepID=UPI0033F42EF6